MNTSHSLLRCTILCAFILLCSCAGRSEQRADLAIIGATLIDGTGSPAKPNRTILIRDGVIQEITDATANPLPDAVKVIHAPGQSVIPGLADMHVHFGSGGFIPRRSNENELTIDQFLHYGVTTVLNVGATGGSRTDIQRLRARQRTGELPGLRIYATGDMLTIPGSHPIATIMHVPESADPATYDWSLRGVAVVATPDEARAVVARNMTDGMDAIKIIVESGPTMYGEHPQMPPEMIRAAVDEASAQGGFVVAHISSLDELEACIDAGVHGIMHTVAEPPFPKQKHWAAMKAQDIFYVPTLSLHGSLLSTHWEHEAELSDPFLTAGVEPAVLASVQQFRGKPGTPAQRREAWNQILRSVKSAHDAGVRLALGTDTNNPRVYPGYSVHRELEALVESGLTPMEAIIIATRSPAEMLRCAADSGTLEPGKRADLLILEKNPLDDIRNTRTLHTVVLGGDVIRE